MIEWDENHGGDQLVFKWKNKLGDKISQKKSWEKEASEEGVVENHPVLLVSAGIASVLSLPWTAFEYQLLCAP